MTFRKEKYLGALRVIAGLCFVLALASPSLAGNFVVIAHKDVPVNALGKAELQAIFLGEKVKWDGIRYIKVVMPEDEELQKSFLQAVVRKTPSQFDNHWAKLAYSGRAVMPPSFSDLSKLVDYVSKHNGAVSFVPAGQPIGTAKTISIK